MKQLKNRWENELKTAVPALSDSVKNAAIPTAETQSSNVKTPSSKVVSTRRKIWQKRGFWASVSGGVACAFALATVLTNALKDPTGVSAREMKVMNVSCNPSVEFVLDEDNVVVSANALNEEGNLVVSAETFVGKTAEEAACLFVEIAQETGFIVVGDGELANLLGADNKISIAFSGDETAADTLFAEVCGRVEGYFSENSIDGTVEKAERITEEEIEAALSECLPYLEDAELRAMDYAQLMENLASSRKETEKIYSQELKSAYYEMKAFAIEQAELETVKANVDEITAAILNEMYTEYTSAVSEIENFRMEYLVNDDSLYQQALAAFRAMKTEYLNYRNEAAQTAQGEDGLEQAVLDALASYREGLDELQNELLLIGETMHKDLDALKANAKDIFTGIAESLHGFGVDKEAIAEKIVEERDKADKEFRGKFETQREKEIGAAQDRWTEMKGSLGKGKTNDGGEIQGDRDPDAEIEAEQDVEQDVEQGAELSGTEIGEEQGEKLPELDGEEDRGEHGQVHP